MEIAKTSLRAVPCGEGAARAAEILERELFLRRGTAGSAAPAFSLFLEPDAGFGSDDTFEIVPVTNGLRLRANGVRGLIYAVGFFLRKTDFTGELAVIPEEVCGVYSPKKPIRGHQLGYRPCSNTYDAWTPEQFERYMTELMYFGMNTVEFIPFTELNEFMRYTGPEMTRILSEKAHALGLEVSLWIPNTDKSEAEELAEREALFRDVPHIDAVFIPGADPGSLPADTLIDRCNKIYDILIKYHPQAKVWPSAQAPHNAPGWGELFLAALANAGPGIAGVITGPNRAFNVDELRRRLPEKYPLRFYPDVTHNLRCEHPVHFDRDDWHYAFANTLSRESVNPRPEEYKRLFDTVAPYTVGSVTYSDGVNDDVNKTVWCALEWDDTLSAAEIAEDYARAYLYGYPTEEAPAAVLLLEKNWSGSPLEKRIDFTLFAVNGIKQKTNCWRFWQLYFRALCDKYVKERMLADTAALGLAKALIESGDFTGAKAALNAPPPENVRQLRAEINAAAKALYDTVGMQLSVQGYGASGWERGATLDTVDLPVTDRQWLMHLLNTASPETVLRAIHRNDVSDGEFYFSFALHWPDGAGQTQAKDFYMNIQGDRPDVNDGTLQMCLAKVYDHFSFGVTARGLQTGTPYKLTVTFFKADERLLREMKVTANGIPLAPPVPSEETALLPPRFAAYAYEIPADIVTDGAVRISLTEQTTGFQIAELKITHRRETA